MGIPLHRPSRSEPMWSASICAVGSAIRSCLMLEPLFRCNLACAGCGKIDYPDKILDQRLSVARLHGSDR